MKQATPSINTPHQNKTETELYNAISCIEHPYATVTDMWS